MKKFINEYKALRSSKSETESTKTSKLRERVTVSVSSEGIPPTETQNAAQPSVTVGTIRTEEYKRDLAEFQARRSLGNKEPLPELPDTPEKKKCSRHSLPVSCTDCATAHDNTFQYEKKSAAKYKKKAHKRAKSAATDHRIYDALPNIQFLFQNQVFMPGSPYPTYSEPKPKRHSRRSHRSPDFVQKQINFNEEEEQVSSPTPIFYKNNSLPVDIKYFLEGSKGTEEIDGVLKGSHSKSSEEGSEKCKGFGDTSEDKLWEVMSELKQFDQWADEQLQGQDSTKSDDCKSDTSAYGLPIASASNLDVNADRNRVWNRGTWGVVPVQVKKIDNVCLESVRRKLNTEINILRKFRHPNIILLMGLFPVNSNIHIICEQCVDSLFAILHVQGRILSAQTAVSYTLDIASALVFLRMQGYIHTELTSHSVMITAHDSAKLADLGPCVRLPQYKPASPKQYELYSPEPQYVNIQDTRESTTGESEPLLSQHSSETYLASNSVTKNYLLYRESEYYRWQAPELFECDEQGFVHPCGKSDVYSLSLILWESCNAAIPWKTLTYEKLKELYTLWKTGIKLPVDGTYPGGLLALLQSGLTLARTERIDLNSLHSTLASVKTKLEDLEYIVIPARVSKKKSDFSSVAWDINSPTDTSECLSPLKQNVQHRAVVHQQNSSPDTSEKDQRSDSSPMYESIRKDTYYRRFTTEKCYVSEDEPSDERPNINYNHLPEREISSACSTPIAKIRARIKDMETPNALHRSDSTEYCSILSPDNRHFAINEDSGDQSIEKPTAKLSRSFTPKSYKPLHIKVPEFNLDTVKSILKENSGSEKSSYNFDIKNYSLPNTPIARSNKLRKNAWLSGDLSATERSTEKLKELQRTPSKGVIECKQVQSAPETPMISNASSLEKDEPHSENFSAKRPSRVDETSPGSDCLDRDSVTGLRRVEPPSDFSPETECPRDRTSSWSYKSTATPDRPTKVHLEDEVLAGVNVKPLVAIHERWIYEANRKTGRSMSLPDDNRSQVQAVKPASHCVDTFQKSLPQLTVKRGGKNFRTHPVSPASQHSGFHWENFSQAREAVAKSINFGSRDYDRFHTWRKDCDKGTITTEDRSISAQSEPKIDQATDTRSIEEFIREMIRKEFQHLLHEIGDDTSTSTNKNDEILNKGVANIVENLKNGEPEKKEIKSFSRVKINGNNKPLLQITFTRSGENSLQVLDNCVNVTICDNNSGKDKLNVSMEDTLTEDVQVHSLKRCQAFNAIQEARSTEDLYIDDDLSTHMQENFGGRVKLIPLHGSLHEILCEREDDCCLLKVKQENGCDTIYFRCDNSDTESRDAIDGCSQDTLTQDTVVYKRSISLVEERIQRIFPKEKRAPTPILRRKTQETNPKVRMRPKSEVFTTKIDQETRVMSSSSPSLLVESDRTDEVEVNLEHAMCYQDSSSEECVRCKLENDDFELLEKKIEEDLAQNISMPNMTSCGCLGKISEENLTEEIVETE